MDVRVFSSSHTWMWKLDHKENWVPKNWCFWTMVLEKALESPLDCKEIQPVHPKGNQFWMFIGRTDDEAEIPILWPPDAKSWLIGKDLDGGKDWKQEEKGTSEDEMVGWHHRLDGREFEQASGDSGEQGSLACCSSWGHKESDTTEQLNWVHYILVLMLSHFSHVQLFVTLGTVACQAPLSMGILQAWILEWVALPSSRGSFWLRDRTQVSCIAAEFFIIWATREAPLYSCRF